MSIITNLKLGTIFDPIDHVTPLLKDPLLQESTLLCFNLHWLYNIPSYLVTWYGV